jgi:hypothetical protein
MSFINILILGGKLQISAGKIGQVNATVFLVSQQWLLFYTFGTPFFSLLKMCIAFFTCFVSVTDNMLPCKHVSQRVVIPPLPYVSYSPQTRFLQRPTLRFISVHGVHLRHVHVSPLRDDFSDGGYDSHLDIMSLSLGSFPAP